MKLCRPELLDVDRHDRGRFASTDEAMNEWLRRYARQSRRDDTAATWVIASPEGRIAAFASLSMTGIDRSEAPESLGKGSPNPVPGLLIGRLAVDHDFEGRGVGTALVQHALALAVELNTSAACKAVVVVALNAEAKAWWLRLGFHCFDEEDEECFDLFLLTAEIEETFGAA